MIRAVSMRPRSRHAPAGAASALHVLWLLLAFVLCAPDAAPAQARPSTPPDASAKADSVPPDPLQVGNAFYDKGDYARAAEQYRIVTRDSVSALRRAYGWFNLGNCHVQTGAYQRAVIAYRRAAEEAPTFSRAYQVLGDVYYTIGAIGEATAAYRRLLELEPESVRARQMLGECALRGGDVTEALRQFEAALKLDNDLPEVHLAMAEANARIRDYKAAQKLLEEAMLRLPRPVAAGWFYLGHLYELDNNARKAVRAYEEGLLLEPKRADYYLRIASLHEQAGDDYLALLILDQGVRAGIERADFHLRRGGIYFRQQRLDRAHAEYKRALALGSPQGRVGIENVAAALFNAGKRAASDSVLAELRRLP